MQTPSHHTIADFTDYLAAKEALTTENGAVICEGSEANMIAWYLLHDRTFPVGAQFVHFDDTLWRGLQSDPAFKRRKEADADSYTWDRLIEGLSDSRAKPIEGPGPSLSELDLGLRTMAREPRFLRRVLGRAMREFLTLTGELRSRLAHSPSGVTYVFVYFSNQDTPQERSFELVARSYIARKRVGRGEVVIGIGLSPHQTGHGSQSDLTYIRFPRWSAEEEAKAGEFERATGHFTKRPPVHLHDDEYPRDKK
jgi:hypothetical protein